MAQPLTNEPRDLKLDDNNDLVFEDGDLVFTRGIDAVVQSCRIALQMFQEEWFLDLDAGLPYWQNILGFKPSVAIAAARIFVARELRLVEGVLEILKLDVTYDGSLRTLLITWQVSTELGDTPVDTIALETGGS